MDTIRLLGDINKLAKPKLKCKKKKSSKYNAKKKTEKLQQTNPRPAPLACLVTSQRHEGLTSRRYHQSLYELKQMDISSWTGKNHVQRGSLI